MLPKVSIVIPTRNRSNLIARAVEHAFKQAYDNFEVIVSNNNSSDGTENVINELLASHPSLIVINHKTTLSLGDHWHTIINEHSTGDYILLIPDDDVITDPNYISDAIQKFRDNLNIGLVFARYDSIDQHGTRLSSYTTVWSSVVNGVDILLTYNSGVDKFIPHLTTVFSRSAYNKVGGFKGDYLSPDMYLWVKILLFFDAGFVDKKVADYMVHPGNLSSTLNPVWPHKDTQMIGELRALAHQSLANKEVLDFAINRLERLFYRRFHAAAVKHMLALHTIDISIIRLFRLNFFFKDFIFDVIRKRLIGSWH